MLSKKQKKQKKLLLALKVRVKYKFTKANKTTVQTATDATIENQIFNAGNE
jgi:hypothetical protein